MKKIIGVLALLSLVLVACGESSVTTKCEIVEEGYESKVELTSKGEKITKQLSNGKMSFADSEFGFSEEDMTEMGEEYAKMTDIDGVEYEYEIKDDFFIDKTEIDYEKADFKELYEINLINVENADYVVLEDTVSGLESIGYECTTK